MAWIKAGASRVNLDNVYQFDVTGMGPYELTARSQGGSAIVGSGYATVAAAEAAIDAMLGTDDVEVV